MLSYIYRVESLRNGKWKPVFYPFSSSTPLESTDLDYIIDKASFLSSNYDNIRIVKVETFLISQFS